MKIIHKLMFVFGVINIVVGGTFDITRYPVELLSYVQTVPFGLNPSIKTSHHPVVGHEWLPWYKNWVTCTVCGTWVATFKEIAKETYYIKALKGFLWLSCATQFSQSFCKMEVENSID